MANKKHEGPNVSRFDIQRKIVANMTSESWRHIPHVSYIYEPDVTEFLMKFKKFDENLPDGKHVTLNTVVLKAIAQALKAAPDMNAHLHFEKELVRGKIVRFDNIDMSVPWVLPSGAMMTVTMKDIGSLSLGGITEKFADTGRRIANTNLTEAMYSVSMHDTFEALGRGRFIKVAQRLIGSKTGKRHRVTPLKGEAKKMYDAIPDEDKLTYEDLKQGTITVSNIGSISRNHNGEFAMLMIIPPQVCAIGIGAVQKKPIVVTDINGNDKIKIASILPLCVCFDHRAMDFSNIKPFLDKLKEIFDNPEEILEY